MRRRRRTRSQWSRWRRCKGQKARAGPAVLGTTIPLTQAYVYARANGYLKRRFVDIGDHVRKGQLLAVIDAPDLDAQVIQARGAGGAGGAAAGAAESQLALATVTVQRYRVLVRRACSQRQDGDTQEADYGSQVAIVAGGAAECGSIQREPGGTQIALQSYEQVRAPFAGVVTERDVDVGALVSAAGASFGWGGWAPQGQSSSAGGTTQAGQANTAGASGTGSMAATSAQTAGVGRAAVWDGAGAAAAGAGEACRRVMRRRSVSARKAPIAVPGVSRARSCSRR